MVSNSIKSDEWTGSSETRGFGYTYYVAAGARTRVGPDRVETLLEFDRANRLRSLRRGPEAAPLMEAEYAYYDNGLLQGQRRANGAETAYTYDDANRLQTIYHINPPDNIILSMRYTYDARNLPTSITEMRNPTDTDTVTFTYDNRGRLIEEVREGLHPYDLAYEYDQGGNRTRRVDALNEIQVQYHYDLENPEEYGSANNRLMYFETFDTSGGGEVLESTTYYYYNGAGNVTRVVTNNEDSPTHYEGTLFKYAKNGQAVSFVVGERWEWDQCMCGEPCCGGLCDGAYCQEQPPVYDYNITYAREFRYDGARARYLNRELNPVALKTDGTLVPVTSTWSDYDGDRIYGHFTMDGASVDHVRSYQPGVGRVTDPLGDPQTEYYHGDLIGTTRAMSDADGAPIDPAAYTAFGELVGGASHRYGYAGTWGYQAHQDFPFLHVGYRYYDPATGRFLQRDPIGIRGGVNVYVYGPSTPTIFVDPTGLDFQGAVQDGTAGAIIGGGAGAAAGAVTGGIAGSAAGGVGVGPGAVAGGLAGGMIGYICGYASGFAGHYLADALFDRHPEPSLSSWSYKDKGICTRGCHNDNNSW